MWSTVLNNGVGFLGRFYFDENMNIENLKKYIY